MNPTSSTQPPANRRRQAAAGAHPIARVAFSMFGTLRPGSIWLSGYSANKLWMDGVYRAVLPLIPPGADVLDLGCGVGLLGMLLEVRGTGNRTHGIEWDAQKAGFARRLGARYPSSRVAQGDLWAEPWPACSVIVLQDVLHYFPSERQERLLARIAAHLPPGGRLVLRVMDGSTGGLAALVRHVERLAVGVGWNRAARVHWRPLVDVREDLLRAGLRILDPAGAGGRSPGNRILVAEKP